MSIYGSSLDFSPDSDEDAAAIAYPGSHVMPSTENRTAELDFGIIPGFIDTPSQDTARQEHEAHACHHPFLRVGFLDPYGNAYPREEAPPTGGTVVLDAKQVETLRDYLTDWLAAITNDEHKGACA